ncbi:Mam3 protein [Starmerella bacillaris]|uniref:Mam3 protein n=1 Tax=Starmerella bacillaris TaxID=1247836 RepID=A0AAV5REZ8_STABA|nr:Mam3 protein [Starmerella bacillaris]
MQHSAKWVRLISVVSPVIRTVRAAPAATPIILSKIISLDEPPEIPSTSDSSFYFRLSMSVVLVLLGGVFAGLTIGLMGQDEVFLQVMAESGSESERKCASKVLELLACGKHWVLVTLLLSNVITNETLPIVLDSILGGGWPAVLSATAAIVIFGEIIPQSICVRYGLPLGAYFAPFVKVLMYIMYPIAVPIAKILDYLLGEDHGTVYKKAGLKSLVSLHHHVGIDRLNEDEVTIISAVLDLKDKAVSQIMTPIEKVFTLSSDTILDEKMVEKILLAGFNRIPIYAPHEPLNFVGMLLVRTLITYDPDDSLPISSFALATLPETSPDTSCLNILNYFQEGKAHMVTVSTNPGGMTGAVGVVTLEDVIEELIGEEIVDESDVYVDVHRAIRRATPAPILLSKKILSQPNTPKLIPSNKASDPMATNNSKITIKHPHPHDLHDPTETQPLLSHPAPGPATHVGSADVYRLPRPMHEIAKSPPGTIVTKEQHLVPSNTDVQNTEREAMAKNLANNVLPTINKLSPIVSDSSSKKKLSKKLSKASLGRRRSSSDSDDDPRTTFSENIVHVNGINKVVIQDRSSSSGSDSDVRIP